MASAATIAEIKRLIQKKHRIELKIARLKNRANRDRQSDTRLKLRLGGLLYLLNWENESEQELDSRLSKLTEILSAAEDIELENYRISGDNALRLATLNRKLNPPKSRMTAEELLKLNHQQISIGGLLVKQKLQNHQRSTLLGALIHMNESQCLPSSKTA